MLYAELGRRLGAAFTAWCADRFGPVPIEARPETRAYDVPWVVLDAARAEAVWGWRPTTPLADVAVQ